MKKKDAFELNALVIEREERALKNYILRKNEEKKALIAELEKDVEKIQRFYEELKNEHKVTSNMVYLHTVMNDVDKNQKKKRIEAINKEINEIKREYLQLKNKKEKILEISSKRREKIIKDNEIKEEKKIVEESVIKKYKK